MAQILNILKSSGHEIVTIADAKTVRETGDRTTRNRAELKRASQIWELCESDQCGVDEFYTKLDMAILCYNERCVKITRETKMSFEEKPAVTLRLVGDY